MDTGLPKAVVDTVRIMHETHNEIARLKLKEKQRSCKHDVTVFLHLDWDESCKYCQIDSCALRACKTCGKGL